MDEQKKQPFLISDAAKQLHVEPHVLRYWEEELSLQIPRNAMGHRIYTEQQIEQFRKILLFKEQGFSLKEIAEKISPEKNITYFPQAIRETQVIQYPGAQPQIEPQDKLEQFKQILHNIMTDALEEQADNFTRHISEDVSVRVNKELDYLLREKDTQDEERYRRLDELIRSTQRARQETAATKLQETSQKLTRKERRFLKKQEKELLKSKGNQ